MTWPFENDTSAITKKLALKSIKADRQKLLYTFNNSHSGYIDYDALYDFIEYTEKDTTSS